MRRVMDSGKLLLVLDLDHTLLNSTRLTDVLALTSFSMVIQGYTMHHGV